MEIICTKPTFLTQSRLKYLMDYLQVELLSMNMTNNHTGLSSKLNRYIY